MKKNIIIISILSILTIITILLIININKIKIKEYNNEYYSLKYDTTWKYIKDNDSFILEHKKSKGKITIKYKLLEDYYIDTKLNDISIDILKEIENQNNDYNLISSYENDEQYENKSYLFEKENEQVLVKIYKKDNLLLIIYYENNSNYYDIVMDSVDTIINSINIKK